jgi:hypothetical protein
LSFGSVLFTVKVLDLETPEESLPLSSTCTLVNVLLKFVPVSSFWDDDFVGFCLLLLRVTAFEEGLELFLLLKVPILWRIEAKLPVSAPTEGSGSLGDLVDLVGKLKTLLELEVGVADALLDLLPLGVSLCLAILWKIPLGELL